MLNNKHQGFLRGKIDRDPLSLSDVARDMLTVEEKATEYVMQITILLATHLLVCSPLSVLSARRKLICEVCTASKKEPVMIEEGREWDTHKKTRAHRNYFRRAEATSQGYRYGKKIEDINTTESQPS